MQRNNNGNKDREQSHNEVKDINSTQNAQDSNVGKSLVVFQDSSAAKETKPKKTCWLKRKVNAIPLSTRLVACTLAVLTVAAFCISLSIRQLVGNYLLEKTDIQLADQAQLIYDNIDVLRGKDVNQPTAGPNDYFMQIRDMHNKITFLKKQIFSLQIKRNLFTTISMYYAAKMLINQLQAQTTTLCRLGICITKLLPRH